MQRNFKYTIHKLDNLPIIIYDYFIHTNSFSGKKTKAYTGSIIRRTSSNSFGIMYHYCFFYGIDKNNIAWVIHNDKYGVECISFIDYLDNFKKYEVDAITNNDNKNNIINRAISVKNKMFHLKENNCEHFVNYSVYNIKISYQSQITKWINNIILWNFECNICLQNDEKIISDFKKFRHKISKPPIIKR